MLKLFVATPERKIVGGISVKQVIVPGESGEMTILPGHATLISTMGTGALQFEDANSKKEVAAVSTGFIQVHNNEVVILADTLELAREIDLERARRAQENAEEKLKAKLTFDEDLVKWQRKLERSRSRQNIAQYLLPPH